jgi:beta-glucosidase
VQLYVSDQAASVPLPIRQLAGFKRVHLHPGQTQTVTFTLTPRHLSLIDDEGRCIVEPGEFQIAVGGCQPSPDPIAQGRTLPAVFEVAAH